eukprot:GHVU01141982.1.p1 GENE.GHVU01141982.1~~GHVU01141982.1.p1  ORF type:complete len:297 (+),score=7.75 GHVU01141982.1:107-997(+)
MKTDISLRGLLACVVGLALLRGASSAAYNDQNFTHHSLKCDNTITWPEACPSTLQQDQALCGTLLRPCRLQDPNYEKDSDEHCHVMYYVLHARKRVEEGGVCGENGCHAYARGQYATVNNKSPDATYQGNHLPRELCPNRCAESAAATDYNCVTLLLECAQGKSFGTPLLSCPPPNTDVVRFKLDNCGGFNETCPQCDKVTCANALGHVNKTLCQGNNDCAAQCRWAKYFHCKDKLDLSESEQLDCIKPEMDKVSCQFGRGYTEVCKATSASLNSSGSLDLGLIAIVLSVLTWCVA